MTTIERMRTVARGPAEQPVWIRPAVAVLLVGTAVLYCWNIAVSGYANEYYSAAAQAAAQDWKAFFFGSLDPSNFITVDKPPAALWVMGLSARIFGVSQWSILLPQAIEGVAAVALLYAAVKRQAGPVAGLMAGAIFAVTPVSVLMFRYNNPDSLLVLLLVAAAYCVVRALENARTGWLLLAGTAMGFAFLTKMLQAFLVVPAFALIYLIAAPTGMWRRIWQLLLAGVAVVVSAGWWLAVVAMVPASQRPYIGGSTTNDPLELAFGYNGLQRIFGMGGRSGPSSSAGSGAGAGTGARGGAGERVLVGPGPGGGFGQEPGITRMFNNDFGAQISWLLPAALIGLVATVVVTWRAARIDRTRAAMVLWGGWLLVTGLVFSFMSGIVHSYYAVALAPAIAAIIGISVPYWWNRRDSWTGRILLAALALVTGGWACVLLTRDNWLPILGYVALGAGVVTAALVLVGVRRWRGLAIVAAVLAVVTAFTGSAAYAGYTAATAHSGGVPAAGPRINGPGINGPGTNGPGANGPGTAGSGGMRMVGPDGGGQGGPDGPRRENAALAKLLRTANTKWAAATTGAGQAASFQLASDAPIMAIGGFSSGDPAPTLAEFQQYVARGEIRYYVPGVAGPTNNTTDPNATNTTGATDQPVIVNGPGGGPGGTGGGPGGGPGGRGTSGAILTWVKANYTATTVGGQTVYDLTRPAK